MSYYVRYFAESPVTLKALSTAIKAVAPDYKIDGGDLMRGSDVLAEVTIDSVGSDLFVEELNARLGAIGQIGGQAAQWVGARIQGAQSIVAIRIDPAINWDLLAPLWNTLPTMATGLTQVDGQGYYDGGNLIVNIA
ncbi:MAG TPA: hypothetical protein VL326_17630 [Kofleriaceae bacterium]|jgi:hypothetical protein|nr:hypothetical protein [Kofleriaceae bacterium]